MNRHGKHENDGGREHHSGDRGNPRRQRNYPQPRQLWVMAGGSEFQAQEGKSGDGQESLRGRRGRGFNGGFLWLWKRTVLLPVDNTAIYDRWQTSSPGW